MADRITPAQRSANMSRIRATGMKPEMTVRRLVHAMGYRFRLHRRNLPGTPDLVFPSRKAVIFVHGCFWHQHPDPTCSRSHVPRSRTEYWESKLQRNVLRDKNNVARLEAAGWRVLVLWECEIKDCDALKARLETFLN